MSDTEVEILTNSCLAVLDSVWRVYNNDSDFSAATQQAMLDYACKLFDIRYLARVGWPIDIKAYLYHAFADYAQFRLRTFEADLHRIPIEEYERVSDFELHYGTVDAIIDFTNQRLQRYPPERRGSGEMSPAPDSSDESSTASSSESRGSDSEDY